MNAYSTGLGGASSALSGATAQADARKSTEMETLSRRFGNNLTRLRDMNGVLHDRIERFMPEPSQLGKSAPSTDAPQPAPGTAASLNYFCSGLDEELSRLDGLLVRLQGIL